MLKKVFPDTSTQFQSTNLIPVIALFEATIVFMILLSSLLHVAVEWSQVSPFSNLNNISKSNRQEIQILQAGFYLDSKPRVWITQR